MIQVDYDIPIPDTFKHRTKYPWDEMEIDHSFLYKGKQTTISGLVSYQNNKGLRKFVYEWWSDDNDCGYRVWRVE